MNKISNKKITNKIIYGIGMLAILTLAVISMPAKANAFFDGYVSHVDGYGFNDISGPVTVPNYIPTPVYVPTPVSVATPTPTLYSSNSNGNPKVAVAVKAAPKKVAVANKPPDTSLAANAISGSNSFLPTGLVQWIFFAILVLLVVILVRKIFSADKNYQSTPMKHG